MGNHIEGKDKEVGFMPKSKDMENTEIMDKILSYDGPLSEQTRASILSFRDLTPNSTSKLSFKDLSDLNPFSSQESNSPEKIFRRSSFAEIKPFEDITTSIAMKKFTLPNVPLYKHSEVCEECMEDDCQCLKMHRIPLRKSINDNDLLKVVLQKLDMRGGGDDDDEPFEMDGGKKKELDGYYNTEEMKKLLNRSNNFREQIGKKEKNISDASTDRIVESYDYLKEKRNKKHEVLSRNHKGG